VKRGIRPIARI